MTLIRKANTSDIAALSASLAQAFRDDPVIHWLFPREAHREIGAQKFFSFTLDRISLPLDEVWCTDDGRAAALWAPPGKWRLGLGDQARLLPEFLRVARARSPRVLIGFNKLESRHPKEPHWYLYFIGTRPDCHGRGHGSALLGHMFERSDAEGLPVFLEATNDDLVPFYCRHGFAVRDKVAIRGGPTLTQMWRDPR